MLSFTKCSFDYFVSEDIDVDELSCVAMLAVNGVPVGEMRFVTRIVDAPRQLNPEIIAHKYNKVFILCWSENASKSEYVQKERLQALERAFPQVKPEQAAKLRIYPMSIEPRAELPSDMKNNYHFGEL